MSDAHDAAPSLVVHHEGGRAPACDCIGCGAPTTDIFVVVGVRAGGCSYVAFIEVCHRRAFGVTGRFLGPIPPGLYICNVPAGCLGGA